MPTPVATYGPDALESTGFSVTVSGATAGNLLIGVWAIRGTTGTTLPSITGWRRLQERASSTFLSGGWYVREATGTSADDFAGDIGGTRHFMAAVVEYSGVDLTDILTTTDFAFNEDNIASAASTCPLDGVTSADQAGAIFALVMNASEPDWRTSSFTNATLDFEPAGTGTNRPGLTFGSRFTTGTGPHTDTSTASNTGITSSLHFWLPQVATPITFSGTIPTQQVTTGNVVDIDLSGYFSGTSTPFTFAEVGTNLSGSGLSINSSGHIVGTAGAVGNYTSVVIRGTDDDLATDDSNAFTVEILSGANSITIDDAAPQARHVYPIKTSGTAAVSRTVSYTGSPGSLQYRLVEAGNETNEIVTWTTFDASPGPGPDTSALNFECPATNLPIYIEVRIGDDTGVTDIETVDWYMGFRILPIGQSNCERIYARPFDTVTPPVGLMVENGTGALQFPNDGAGMVALTDRLQAMYGCAVVYCESAVGSSPLTQSGDSGGSNYWASPTSTLFTDMVTDVTNMTSGDDVIHFAYWNQGEEDMAQGVSTEEWYGINVDGGINQLLREVRSRYAPPDGGTLPVIMSTGVSPDRNDTFAQQIRDAMISIIQTDPLIYEASEFHLEGDGTGHQTIASYEDMGENIAALYSVFRGDTTFATPRVIAADISGTQITLEFDVALDTTVTNYTPDQIRLDDGGTLRTPSAFTRLDSYKARLDFSTITNTDDLTLYLPYGNGDGNVGTAEVWPHSTAISLPGTGGTHKFPAAVFSGRLIERQ